MAEFESICTINVDAALEELENFLNSFLTYEEYSAEENLDSDAESYTCLASVRHNGWKSLGNGCYRRGR